MTSFLISIADAIGLLRRAPWWTIAILASPLALGAQQSRPARDPDGEWRNHHRDLAGSRYSPLAQIDSSNVDRMAIAWTWVPDSTLRDFRNESTPLMVGGTLYFTSGLTRSVVAADPATGATRWMWSIDEGSRLRKAPRRGAGRGVSYWRSGNDERIFVVTPGFQLVALDARTGKPIPSFGDAGKVDLKRQLGVPIDVDSAAIGNSSPPLVFQDLVILGPALEVGARPPSMRNVPGRILALDARTGALRWRFNPIPGPGEFGHETWGDSSSTYTGNAGAWAPMSLDAKRGWLYLPMEDATGDYYGGHRHGDNLFATTILCLDARTGKRIWHFQTVHHDIWDYDNPTAPVLADVTIGGRRREIVAQMTKQAFVYVLDRVTGKPIWPIVERPVPQSDVPGERTSATQPFPTRPAPFDRQGVTVDDLIDFTPELRALAVEAIAPYRIGPLFTPPSLASGNDGKKGTLSLPGSVGGANWEHGAFDPQSGILYVGSFTDLAMLALAHETKASDMAFIRAGVQEPSVKGLPLIKPPYSRVTAIDLNTGEHRWMVPNGPTPREVAEHPALAGVTIPQTGGFTRPMMLATRTLLFVGEGWGGSATLRVHDKATGRLLREIPLPGAVSSPPMSYEYRGRQYVALWAGDARKKPAMQLVVLSLATP